jgi:hypothetical protein
MESTNIWVAVILTGLWFAVGGCGDDWEDLGDDDVSGNCPQVSGNWTLSYHCSSTDGDSGGVSRLVELLQVGCEIELIQSDDNTLRVL